MDSTKEQIFWTLTIVATFIHCRDFYDHHLAITLLIFLEAVTYGICFLKFRKEVATHAITSKIWTLTLLALVIQITITYHSNIKTGNNRDLNFFERMDSQCSFFAPCSSVKKRKIHYATQVS